MPAIQVSKPVQESAAEIAAQQSSEELGPLPSVAQDAPRLGVPPTTDPSILADPRNTTTKGVESSVDPIMEDNTSPPISSTETETTARIEQVPAGPNETEAGQSEWISGYIWISVVAIPVLAWLVWRWLNKRQTGTDETEREARDQKKTRDVKNFDINSNAVSSTLFDQSLDELDDLDLVDHDQATISSAETLVAGTHWADHDSGEDLDSFSVADAKSFDFNAELDEFESASKSKINPVLEGKLTDGSPPIPTINHPTMRAENPQFDLEDSFVAATSSSRIPGPPTFKTEIQRPSPGQPAFTAGPRSAENEFAFDEEEDDDLDDDSELDLEFQVLKGDVSIERETESNLELEAEIEASESNMDLAFAAEADGPDLIDHDLGETISLDEDDSDAGYDFDIERMIELEDSDSSLDLADVATANADRESGKSAKAVESEDDFNLNRPSSIAEANAEARNCFHDDSDLDSNLTIEVSLDEIEASSGIDSDLDLPNVSSPKDTLSAPALIHTPPHSDVAAGSQDTTQRVHEISAVQSDSGEVGLEPPAESSKAPSAADTIRDDGISIVEPEFEQERFSILQSQIDELERENELLNSSLMSARIESERLEQDAIKSQNLHDQLAEVQDRNSDLESQLESLKTELDQTQTENRQIDQLTKRLDATQAECESLKASVTAAENQSELVRELHSRIETDSKEIQSFVAAHDSQKKEIEQLQQLLQESDQIQARLDESEKHNLELESRLKSLNRDLEQAQTNEQARDALQDQLEAAIAEKESLAQDLERAASQLAAKGNTKSSKRVVPVADSEKELAKADPEFYKRFELRLKKEYKKRKQAERELEQAEEHRNELSNSLRQARLELKQIQESSHQNEVLAQRIEQLESQLRSQASIEDDLIRINGIGPVIKRKLHEIGVTSFDQIARWNDDAAAEIETKLNLKGKIKRENWVEQAMAFAAEKRRSSQ